MTFWRAQLLPVGRVQVGDMTIDFTQEDLRAAAQAFVAGTPEIVPVYATKVDPGNVVGFVRRVLLQDDGLDMVVETDARGDQMIESLPGLWPSACVARDYRDSRECVHQLALLWVVCTSGNAPDAMVGMRTWERVTEDGEPV